MKNQYWVLVANSSSARLFRLEKMKELSEIHTFVHPQSRFKEQDLVDSSPGVANESASPSRHAMEPHSTQKDHESEEFAKNISQYLDAARNDSTFSRLYITAGPTFLSNLRKMLHPQTLELVAKQVTKDLVHADKAQILNEILS